MAELGHGWVVYHSSKNWEYILINREQMYGWLTFTLGDSVESYRKRLGHGGINIGWYAGSGYVISALEAHILRNESGAYYYNGFYTEYKKFLKKVSGYLS